MHGQLKQALLVEQQLSDHTCVTGPLNHASRGKVLHALHVFFRKFAVPEALKPLMFKILVLCTTLLCQNLTLESVYITVKGKKIDRDDYHAAAAIFSLCTKLHTDLVHSHSIAFRLSYFAVLTRAQLTQLVYLFSYLKVIFNQEYRILHVLDWRFNYSSPGMFVYHILKVVLPPNGFDIKARACEIADAAMMCGIRFAH